MLGLGHGSPDSTLSILPQAWCCPELQTNPRYTMWLLQPWAGSPLWLSSLDWIERLSGCLKEVSRQMQDSIWPVGIPRPAIYWNIFDIVFVWLLPISLSPSLLPTAHLRPKALGLWSMGWNLQNHELKSTLPPSLFSEYFYHGHVKLANIHSKWFSVYMQSCVVNIPI